jgi:Fibronectin type III domain
LSFGIAQCRKVSDNPGTAIRPQLSPSLLLLTHRFLEMARIIFLLILLGSASCIPVFGQTAKTTPVALSSVTLQWDKSPGRDVKGYRVHYGIAARKYQGTVDVGKRTTCKVSNLVVGKRYYFVVVAYNEKGESPPSNECSSVVLPMNLQKHN